MADTLLAVVCLTGTSSYRPVTRKPGWGGPWCELSPARTLEDWTIR